MISRQDDRYEKADSQDSSACENLASTSDNSRAVCKRQLSYDL